MLSNGDIVGYTGNIVGYTGNIAGYTGNIVGYTGNIVGFPTIFRLYLLMIKPWGTRSARPFVPPEDGSTVHPQ